MLVIYPFKTEEAGIQLETLQNLLLDELKGSYDAEIKARDRASQEAEQQSPRI
jgi:hypothetical protein